MAGRGTNSASCMVSPPHFLEWLIWESVAEGFLGRFYAVIFGLLAIKFSF